MSQDKAILDYETRSACIIGDTGSWKYSLDPTTEVLCVAFRLPYWETGRTALWHPQFPHLGIDDEGDLDELGELFDWAIRGNLLEGWNTFFEVGIWNNICVPRFGWPEVNPRQWRDAAAQAAAHALPRKLEHAADALKLEIRKDTEGAAVMKKMSKPRKPKKEDWRNWGRLHAPCKGCKGEGRVASFKKDGTPTKKGMKCPVCEGSGVAAGVDLPPMPLLWHESKELMERLWEYCRVDVLAEEAIAKRVPELSDDETEVYLLDQVINTRGFELDPEAIDVALDLIDTEFADLNAELAQITEGKVLKATQRAKMLAWFNDNGLDIEDTQGATLDEAAEREGLPDHVKRALTVVRTLGKSSTAKYETMKDWLCPDNRVRGGLLYHGASTGRYTGRGVQPHNFPRGTLKKDQTHPEFVWAMLKTRDREFIAEEFGSVMQALSNGLRGVIRAKDGYELFVSDYNAIEPRVTFWLAGDEDALNVYRQGRDIYCEMASFLYGRTITKNDAVERQLGKSAIIGCGYGLGASKFVEAAHTLSGGEVQLVEDVFCAECGGPSRGHWRDQDHEFVFHPGEENIVTALKAVEAYRKKYWRVKNLWAKQEAAMIRAVNRAGEEIPAGRVSWFCDDEVGFLYGILPSGRKLAYPDPQVIDKKMPWGEWKPVVTYMGVDTYTRQWKRQSSYGGHAVENLVQAIARDLLAATLVRLEQTGVYLPVLSVHDEVICEAPKGAGSLDEFSRLMAEVPDWADGLPIVVESWSGPRYKK